MRHTSMEKPASRATAGCKPLTTFVQTDTKAFRQVVQWLTGPSERDAIQGPAATKVAGIQRPTTNLHGRRRCLRPKLEIVKPPVNFKPLVSPTRSQDPSCLPSPVNTPSMIFSELCMHELEKKISELNSEEEEKAIKERRFYLHPSPTSRTGYTKPELLALFPMRSP